MNPTSFQKLISQSLRSLIVFGMTVAHAAPLYNYHLIKTYPHNINSFTEGLILDKNILYESSGLNGKSFLDKMNFDNYQSIKKINLDPQYFAEGITLFHNRIYQLTYQSRLGFIYNDNLKVQGQFKYLTEGWGLTNNDKELIMSDGSYKLTFINPYNFQVTKTLIVHDALKKIDNINSLQYVNGVIYANVWLTNYIAIIDAKNGTVKGWINLQALVPDRKIYPNIDVLNGIAYNAAHHTLLVTGKFWPQMYEIKILQHS